MSGNKCGFHIPHSECVWDILGAKLYIPQDHILWDT